MVLNRSSKSITGEVEAALATRAELIGINNRNLVDAYHRPFHHPASLGKYSVRRENDRIRKRYAVSR